MDGTLNPTPATPVWLTAVEAAAHLRVATRTIYALVRSKKLRAATVGVGRRSLRFRVSWLDEFVEANSTIREIRG